MLCQKPDTPLTKEYKACPRLSSFNGKEEQLYLGVDNDGALRFRGHLVHYSSGSLFHFTERYLVALVLTNLCCERGLGKV